MPDPAPFTADLDALAKSAGAEILTPPPQASTDLETAAKAAGAEILAPPPPKFPLTPRQVHDLTMGMIETAESGRPALEAGRAGNLSAGGVLNPESVHVTGGPTPSTGPDVNPKTGRPLQTIPYGKGIFDLPLAEGVEQMGRGALKLGEDYLLPKHTSVDEFASAGSDIAEGLMKAALPFVGAAFMENPAGVTWAVIKSTLAAKLGQTAAETLQASPEVQRLAGNVSALMSGTKSASDFMDGSLVDAAKVAGKWAQAKGAALSLTAKLGVTNPGLGTGVVPGVRVESPYEEPIVEQEAAEVRAKQKAATEQELQQAVANQPPPPPREPTQLQVPEPAQPPIAYVRPEPSPAPPIEHTPEGPVVTVAPGQTATPPRQILHTITSEGRHIEEPLNLEQAAQEAGATILQDPQQAVAEARTQVDTTPSEGQKAEGNYQKGHVTLHGLDITLENPVGTQRTGTAPDGTPWSVTMPADYGYVKRTEGADGDHVDVYIGPNPASPKAFVIDQVDPDTGKFDEHKAVLGVDTEPQARSLYEQGFSDGKGAQRIGGITEMPIQQFKEWAETGDTSKPLAPEGVESTRGTQAAARVPADRTVGAPTEAAGLSEAGSGEPGPVRPRFPPPEADELFQRQPPEAHAHRFTPDVVRELSRIEDELTTFPFVPRHWDWSPESQVGLTGNAAGGHANITAGNAGAEVYHDILAYAPVNRVTSGRRKGQPAKQASGDRAKIIQAVRRLMATHDVSSGLMEGALRVAERRAAGDYAIISHPALPPTWGTEAPPALVDALEQVYDAPEDAWEADLAKMREEEGDASFNPEDFERPADRLDTGELQPRLPEAGAVREEEHATPQFEAPFSLTPETGERTAVEPSLFGDERPKFGEAVAPYRTDPAPIFYSGLTRAAEGLKQARGTPEQMAAMIEKAPGVKKEELEWSGVLPWIREQASPVTRDAIVDYLRKNELQVTETVLPTGVKDDRYQEYLAVQRYVEQLDEELEAARSAKNKAYEAESDDFEALKAKVDRLTSEFRTARNRRDHLAETTARRPAKFATYTLPGGENYRELLVQLPLDQRFEVRKAIFAKYQPELTRIDNEITHVMYVSHDRPALRRLQQEREDLEGKRDAEADEAGGEVKEGEIFRSGHFQEPNVVAHVRFNDRTDADGKRVLFVEEVQSDWHQKGRRHGYKTEERRIDGHDYPWWNEQADRLFGERSRAPEQFLIGGKTLSWNTFRIALADRAVEHGATYDTAYSWAGSLAHDLAHRGEALDDALEGFDPEKADFFRLLAEHDPQQAERKRKDAVAFRTAALELQPVSKEAELTRQWRQALANRDALAGKPDEVPDAPFKTTWPELALKRMVRYAAEHGYDRLAWTTGEQQAERYDLSKQLASIKAVRSNAWGSLDPSGRTTIGIVGYDHDGHQVINERVEETALEGVVGKDLAEKILAQQKGDEHSYAGLDLKVGGEGMKGFYDRILPTYLNKFAKPFGAKVTETKIVTAKAPPSSPWTVRQSGDLFYAQREGDETHGGGPAFSTRNEATLEAGRRNRADSADVTSAVHALDVTPQMRDTALRGLPLFERIPNYPRRPDTDVPASEQRAAGAVRDAERAARDAVSARTGTAPVRPGPTVLGLGITPELVRQGRLELRGLTLTQGAHDLAAAAQIARDPRFETLRVVWVKSDEQGVDHVLATEAISTRLPDAVYSYLPSKQELGFVTQFRAKYGDDERKWPAPVVDQYARLIRDSIARFHHAQVSRMARLGADGYYLIHNHPSGNAIPSIDDRVMTAKTAVRLTGLRGHIVIDSGEYAVIDRKGDYTLHRISEHERLHAASVPHDVLGAEVMTPQQVRDVGARLTQPGGAVLIFATKGKDAPTRLSVRAIESVPVAMLDESTFGRFIQNRRAAYGGSTVFAHVPVDSEKAALRWYRDGVLRDVVSDPRMPSVAEIRGVTERPRGTPRTTRVGQPESSYQAPKRPKIITDAELRRLAQRHGRTEADERAEAEKRGYTIQAAVFPGAKELSEHVLTPAAKQIVNAVRHDTSVILGVIAPAHVGVAPVAAGIIKAHNAAHDQRVARVSRLLDSVRKIMDGWTHDKVKLFWDVMENLAPLESLPRPDRQFVQLFRTILKRYTDELLDQGLLEHYLEYYFPHEWKQGSIEGNAIRRLLGRRPIQGRESYRKRRSIPTMREGLEAGLEPTSWNPADQVFAKVVEMSKSINARAMQKDLKKAGFLVYVRADKARPELIRHYEQVPEAALGTVYGPRVPEQQFGRVVAGHYYGPPEVVRLLKNYISPGLMGRSIAFDAYKMLKNETTSALLGWSSFHIWMTGIEAMMSKASVGLEALARGEVGPALKTFAQVNPLGVAHDLVRGYRAIQDFYSRDATANDTAGIIGAIIQGGGGFGWSLLEHENAPRKFASDIRRFLGALGQGSVKEAAGAAGKAALHLPMAAVELPMDAIMTHWVPYLKVAAFLDMAEMEQRRLGPDATLEDQRKVYGRAWDAVDDRFGQLRYANLFWNNTFKQILTGSFLSVGWQVGSLRHGVGVLGQIPRGAKYLKETLEGGGGGGLPPAAGGPEGEEPLEMRPNEEGTYERYREHWLQKNAAWMLALIAITTTADAIYQHLHTGKMLGEDKQGHFNWSLALRDAVYPRTGVTGPSGREERRYLIGYLKDYVAWVKHPWGTLENKLSPALHTIAELVENEDYFGNAIWDNNDPFLQRWADRILFAIKSVEPIGLQNAKRIAGDRASATTLLKTYLENQAVPFQPASAEAERSAAENYMHDLIPPAHRTKEEAARMQARQAVRQELRAGDIKAATETAREAGLSRRSVEAIRRTERLGSLRSAFQSVTWPEALKVMDLATPDERAALRAPFMQKASRAMAQTRSSAERTAIMKARNAALGIPVPTS